MIFPSKPSILGYPHLWNPTSVDRQTVQNRSTRMMKTLCWALKKSWSEKERRIQQQGVEQLSQIRFKTTTADLTSQHQLVFARYIKVSLQFEEASKVLKAHGGCVGNKWSHSWKSSRFYWFGGRNSLVLMNFTCANALDGSLHGLKQS